MERTIQEKAVAYLHNEERKKRVSQKLNEDRAEVRKRSDKEIQLRHQNMLLRSENRTLSQSRKINLGYDPTARDNFQEVSKIILKIVECWPYDLQQKFHRMYNKL
jgi:hypothetical protein